MSWHPSGESLVFMELDAQTGNDLMILPLEGDRATGWKPGKPAALLKARFNEGQAAFSPDGRWLAYRSDETGRSEVYVRPFPALGGRWQVSTDGGVLPTWSRTRKELFYRGSPAPAGDEKLMVVPYLVEGDSFHVGRPRVWSEVAFEFRGTNRTFDLHPDGQRFAVLKSLTTPAEPKRDRLTLIVGFADELRRIAPAR